MDRVYHYYHIHVDNSIETIHQTPRRVPVAIRDKLKETLDILVQQDIIQPVKELTSWINSIVVMPRKITHCKFVWILRISIEPYSGGHYPLPSIEDVATRLHGA